MKSGRPATLLVLVALLLGGRAEGIHAAGSEDSVIDVAHFRVDLATRALFEESNRQRAAAGLPVLAPLAAAQTAALWQAQYMAQTGAVGHVNTTDRSRKNIDDRARAAGIAFRFLAENVAMNFATDYEPRRSIYSRPGPNGVVIRSYEPNGPPLRNHTYASLARVVVTQWMNSSGHRKNLLSRDAQYLGCAAAPGVRDLSHGLGNVYCAQVFVTLR